MELNKSRDDTHRALSISLNGHPLRPRVCFDGNNDGNGAGNVPWWSSDAKSGILSMKGPRSCD